MYVYIYTHLHNDVNDSRLFKVIPSNCLTNMSMENPILKLHPATSCWLEKWFMGSTNPHQDWPNLNLKPLSFKAGSAGPYPERKRSNLSRLISTKSKWSDQLLNGLSPNPVDSSQFRLIQQSWLISNWFHHSSPIFIRLQLISDHSEEIINKNSRSNMIELYQSRSMHSTQLLTPQDSVDRQAN